MLVARQVHALKLGGSILTYPDKKPDNLDELTDLPQLFMRSRDEIKRYGQEIAEAQETNSSKDGYELWISHGVKQWGHDAVGFLGVVPEVSKYCAHFNKLIVEILEETGLALEPIDPALTCSWNQDLKTFEVTDMLKKGRNAFRKGRIPVSWGTVVPQLPAGHAIMSGDDTLLYTGLLRRADEGIMFLDVPVSDKDPKSHPGDSKPIKLLRSHRELSATVDRRDKTGGLIGKIAKMELLALSGTRCQIVDATPPGNIRKALTGETIGTVIQPDI